MKAYFSNLIRSLASQPLVTKALHTFWQAFLAALLVSGFKLDKATIIAATAAGLSAVKTLVLQTRS